MLPRSQVNIKERNNGDIKRLIHELECKDKE